MKSLEQLTEQISKIEKFETFDIQDDVEQTSKAFTKCIIEASKNQVKPDSEEGKDIVKKGNFIRRIGSNFLNLFKIELTITFAGVTLLHLEIPKINNKILND